MENIRNVVEAEQASPQWPRLGDYETPKLVIDRRRLERNIARMHARAAQLGVVIRPHIKTAKALAPVRMAVDPDRPRLTVSTLKEADFAAAAGFRDILYAVGMAPNKIEHAARLRRDGVDLTLTLDNLDTVRSLGEAAARLGVTLPVMIEVDTDGHRSGLPPADPQLLQIAREISAYPQLRLKGVMAHAGDSYNCKSLDAIADMAEVERSGAVAAAGRIRAEGFACPAVSVGSTPTALMARSLHGVTEMRVGVYMFFDLVMAGLKVCSTDDIALSVLTTVIGHQASKGWVITDAGWMALSRDRGTQSQAADQGYGLVCTEDGRLLDDVLVTGTNQEHGIVASRPGRPALDVTRFPVGTRLRVLPNHACATGAQHDRYLVVGDDGVTVLAEWPRINGW